MRLSLSHSHPFTHTLPVCTTVPFEIVLTEPRMSMWLCVCLCVGTYMYLKAHTDTHFRTLNMMGFEPLKLGQIDIFGDCRINLNSIKAEGKFNI